MSEPNTFDDELQRALQHLQELNEDCMCKKCSTSDYATHVISKLIQLLHFRSTLTSDLPPPGGQSDACPRYVQTVDGSQRSVVYAEKYEPHVIRMFRLRPEQQSLVAAILARRISGNTHRCPAHTFILWTYVCILELD